MTKLILAAMVAINLTDTIAKLNNPDNPKHTFKRLLYSLAHDTMITNILGNDIPIRTATMTRNRSKIRKDLMNLINSLKSIIQYGKKSLDNIVNVRNKNVRNITKKIIKVWTFLLRAQINSKKNKSVLVTQKLWGMRYMRTQRTTIPVPLLQHRIDRLR